MLIILELPRVTDGLAMLQSMKHDGSPLDREHATQKVAAWSQTAPAFTMSKRTHVSASQNLSFEAGIILGELARSVAAEDIFVVAQQSEFSDWFVLHEGQGHIRLGIDAEQILAAQSGRHHGLHWVPNQQSGLRDTLLIMPMHGSRGEHFVVSWLFVSSSSRDRDLTETKIWQARGVLQSVVEFVMHASRLQCRLDGAKAALNCVDAGVVLLDLNCSVIFENATAQRLLTLGDGLKRRGQSIAATDPSDAVRFRMAIETALATEAQGTKVTAPLFALKRGKDQRPLLVCIVPTGIDAHATDSAALILYLYDPESDVAHLLRSACRLYGLSPVESELSGYLACGHSLAEAAAALRIKEMTARGYLKQIYVKTGVNRQAALVQLLLSSIIHIGGDAELLVM